MKVLQVTGGISPRYGGSKALLGMCRELREQGIETHIATTNSDPEERPRVPLGLLVEVNGSLVYHFSSPALSKYGFSRELSRWLKVHTKDYDLVHFHGIYSHGLISGVASARRCRVPYVIRPMGELAPWCMQQGRLRKSAYMLALGRRYLNGASAIHCTAREESEAAEKMGIHAPAAIIPLGVDESDFDLPPFGAFRQDYPWMNGKKIVLFLSRIDPKKGLELLIEAVNSLRSVRDDFALVIGGSGEKHYEEKIRNLVRDSGFKEQTVFTGFINGSAKRALLRDSDIFVLPSYDENFGMAIAEAMAAGLPVVVSNNVNIYREIDSSGAGIVTTCDAKEFATAINRILDDDSLRDKMGKNARKLVEEKFRWKTIASEVIQLYQSILQESS